MGKSQPKDTSNIKSLDNSLLKNLPTQEQWSYGNKVDKIPDTELRETNYKYDQTIKDMDISKEIQIA